MHSRFEAGFVDTAVERGGKHIKLQPREFRLLEYLVRNRGRIVTRTMLLQAVWDYYFDPQNNVIDVQISRLRRKIDRDLLAAVATYVSRHWLHDI